MNKTTLNSQKEKHSMLSLRRATFVGLAAHRLRNISIHALLAESDADNGDAGNGCDAISIHALLAESDPFSTALRPAANISIHALLAESDERPQHNQYTHIAISIHALLAESDLPVFLSGFWAYLFLSTLSLRRATHCIWILCRQHPDFYPRSPCGERRGSSSKSTRCLRISIHALLAESDAWCMSRKTPVQAAFLSTLSLRRATLPETAAVVPSRQFLSTLSLRRATFAALYDILKLFPISIHALLAESDKPSLYGLYDTYAFLSTLSLRRATPVSALRVTSRTHFYPRSPCGERLPG